MNKAAKEQARHDYSSRIDFATDRIKENKSPEGRRNGVLSDGQMWTFEERPMGSGGVGQVKVAAGEIRIQLAYGHGRSNYAECAIIKL